MPCSATRAGGGDASAGPEVVFKNSGGLPELAHRETRESQGCCNGWQEDET